MALENHLRTGPPTRLFFAIFILLGILGLTLLWTSVRLFLEPPDEPKAFIGPLLIGSVLTGIGVIMPFVLRRARKREAFRGAAQQQRPAEPWLWRDDWASGRITGSTPSAAKALWLFAFAWNGFTWPVAWLFLSEPDREPGVHVVLLFPAAGLVIIWLAIRATLQARKYGASVLVLRTIPGVIGRTIEGDIDTKFESAPPDGFDVRLQCSRHYTRGRGKHRRTDRQTVWKDHVTIPSVDLSRGPAGVRVPFAFAIPPSTPSTFDSNPNEGIQWHILVSAKTAGVDYSDSFEVPVYATGAPILTDAERDALMTSRRAHAAAFVPEAPVMRVLPGATGGSVFHFKPRVKFGNALGALLMTALTAAATYYLWQRGIPVAPYFVGFFAMLFAVGTLFALAHSSTVTVSAGTVVIRHRVLGIGTTRRFGPGEIVDVKSEVVGEGNAQSFEVKVFTSKGKSFSAGAMIPTQVEADWSAEQLRAAIVPAAARLQEA